MLSRFRREFFVFQIVGRNEFEHGVTKEKPILPVIEAPRHFVKIGRQILRRNPMPRAHDPALEQTESRLHGIGVNIAVNVNTGSVCDCLVLVVWSPWAVRAKAAPGLMLGFLSPTRASRDCNACSAFFTCSFCPFHTYFRGVYFRGLALIPELRHSDRFEQRSSLTIVSTTRSRFYV